MIVYVYIHDVRVSFSSNTAFFCCRQITIQQGITSRNSTLHRLTSSEIGCSFPTSWFHSCISMPVHCTLSGAHCAHGTVKCTSEG